MQTVVSTCLTHQMLVFFFVQHYVSKAIVTLVQLVESSQPRKVDVFKYTSGSFLACYTFPPMYFLACILLNFS
jgi:hypothetical protein